ncbi:MAG: MATE family efflux transporter [Holdemania massiliensis]
MKLNNMTITSVTAIGNGMSNYTAQNAGAGLPDRIEAGLSAGIKLAAGIALVFTGLYLLAGPVFVGLFITDGNQAALSAGVLFLRIVSPFYLVIAVKLIADGILRGVNRMKLFMSATLTDLVIRVVCAAIFSRGLGLTGIWLSWPIGWIIAASLSLFFYHAVKQQRFDIPPTDIRLETAEEAAQAQWVQREA